MKFLDFLILKIEVMRSSVDGMLMGVLFYHKVIDTKKPRGGLVELRYVDPRKIRKVTEYEAKTLIN